MAEFRAAVAAAEQGQDVAAGPSKDSRTEKQALEAKQFFAELLDSVESLTALADEQGPRTLADLLYLHSAIAEGSFVDAYPGESQLLAVVDGLPSAERWRAFVQVECMLAPG